jgi:hypothetical protein
MGGRRESQSVHRRSHESSASTAQGQRGTDLREVPAELSPEDLHEIIEVFRILKQWRDERGR